MGAEETIADAHLAHQSCSPSRRAGWGLEVPAQPAKFNAAIVPARGFASKLGGQDQDLQTDQQQHAAAGDFGAAAPTLADTAAEAEA